MLLIAQIIALVGLLVQGWFAFSTHNTAWAAGNAALLLLLLGLSFQARRAEVARASTRTVKPARMPVAERLPSGRSEAPAEPSNTPTPTAMPVPSQVIASGFNALADAVSSDVLNALPIGLLLIDRELTVHGASRQSLKMMRYEEHNIIGMAAASLFEDYAEKRREIFLEDLQKKASGKLLELMILARDGQRVPVDVSFSAIDDNFAIICLIDVRDRKELERAKQELISMVSHDLRSPLTSVGANMDMLLAGAGGSLTSDGQRMIEGTSREIKRLMRLIGDILEIGKMESGKLDLTLDVVPLQAIVEAAEEAVAGLAKRQNIEIHSEIPDIDVNADGERMVQVIVNLLSNAIKFSPQGQRVDIAAKRDSSWVEIRVIDRGRGIPEEYREAVFEKFRQVSREDKRKPGGGSGLGLPICKAIVEEHKGMIGFDSTPGSGTTFWIKLPAYDF